MKFIGIFHGCKLFLFSSPIFFCLSHKKECTFRKKHSLSNENFIMIQIKLWFVDQYTTLLKCTFLALVSSFHHCSLQNLTDANEEYQKQIEDMKAQIEEAVGQVERYSDDYVKLKVRTWDLHVHFENKFRISSPKKLKHYLACKFIQFPCFVCFS